MKLFNIACPVAPADGTGVNNVPHYKILLCRETSLSDIMGRYLSDDAD